MTSRRIVFLTVLVVVLAGSPVWVTGLFATTWSSVEVTCPVSGTINSFQAPMSSGSYIYQWPSKYQYVYWPYTTTSVLYSCKKCYYTAFMSDFEHIAAEKIPDVRKLLAAIEMDTAEDYRSIPMAQRLAAAEKVYTLFEKDDEFWSLFYRVKGYHLEAASDVQGAAEARFQAIGWTQKLLADSEKAGQKKEHLLIRGAMRYFVGEPDGALRDLEEAKELVYTRPDVPADRLEGFNEYLDSLLAEYIEAVKEGKNLSDAPAS